MGKSFQTGRSLKCASIESDISFVRLPALFTQMCGKKEEKSKKENNGFFFKYECPGRAGKNWWMVCVNSTSSLPTTGCRIRMLGTILGDPFSSLGEALIALNGGMNSAGLSASMEEGRFLANSIFTAVWRFMASESAIFLRYCSEWWFFKWLA